MNRPVQPQDLNAVSVAAFEQLNLAFKQTVQILGCFRLSVDYLILLVLLISEILCDNALFVLGQCIPHFCQIIADDAFEGAFFNHLIVARYINRTVDSFICFRIVL